MITPKAMKSRRLAKPKYEFDDLQLWEWLQDMRLRPLISKELGTESKYDKVDNNDETSVHWVSKVPGEKEWFDSVEKGIQPFADDTGNWTDVKCAFYSLYHEMQYRFPKQLPNLSKHRNSKKKNKTLPRNYQLLKKMLNLLGEQPWFFKCLRKADILDKTWTPVIFAPYWSALVNDTDWGV